MKLEEIILSKVRVYMHRNELGELVVYFTDLERDPSKGNGARYTYWAGDGGQFRSWRKDSLREDKPYPLPKRFQNALRMVAFPLLLETSDDV